MKEKIKYIAEHYGYEAQSRQCIEEMAELTQALNKFWRKQLDCGRKTMWEVPFGTAEENQIKEELADVEIMLCQLKYFHRISEQGLEEEIKKKVDRQIGRIKESR